MISVGCPNCGTLYQIPDQALGEQGRSMRCTACGEKWFCTREHIKITHTPPQSVTQPANQPGPRDAAEIETVEAEADPWNQETPDLPNTDQALASTKAAGLNQKIGNMDQALQVVQKRFGFAKLRKEEQLDDVEAEAEPLLAAERKKRQINTIRHYLTPQWGAIAATALILLIFLTMPKTFVSMSPSYASLYQKIGIDVNLEGLAFENIITRLEGEQGTQLLMVEGDITNITSEAKSVPRLKFFVKNADGADIYTWVIAPPKSALLGGESVRFRARYADPAPETVGIQVRFFNSKDLSAKPRS